MGNAFILEYADELLPIKQKKELLGRNAASSVLNTAIPRVVLVSDEGFSTEALERAIALCKEKNAMLDLLCVTSKGDNSIMSLATVWPLLENKTDLDFQVTRRNGDLLVEIKNYIRERPDISTLLISVSKKMRNRLEQYKKSKNSLIAMKTPEVKLLDGSIYA